MCWWRKRLMLHNGEPPKVRLRWSFTLVLSSWGGMWHDIKRAVAAMLRDLIDAELWCWMSRTEKAHFKLSELWMHLDLSQNNYAERVDTKKWGFTGCCCVLDKVRMKSLIYSHGREHELCTICHMKHILLSHVTIAVADSVIVLNIMSCPPLHIFHSRIVA